MKQCPKCNAENAESNKFCSECGMPIKEENTITNTSKKSKKVIKKAIIAAVVIALLIFGIYEAYIWIYWGGMSKESRDTWKEFGDTMSSVQQVYDDAETKSNTETEYNTLSFENKHLYTPVYSYADIEKSETTLFKIECDIKEVISNKDGIQKYIINFDNQLFFIEYINIYEEIELTKGNHIILYGMMEDETYLLDSNTELRKIYVSYIEKE